MTARYRQREMFRLSRLGKTKRRRSYAKIAPDSDSVIGEMRQIPDGPAYYPESCVIYTRFKSYPLRAMFAYLREKEHYLQADLIKYAGLPVERILRTRLEEVESHLIWMAANLLAGSKTEEEYYDEQENEADEDWT